MYLCTFICQRLCCSFYTLVSILCKTSVPGFTLWPMVQVSFKLILNDHCNEHEFNESSNPQFGSELGFCLIFVFLMQGLLHHQLFGTGNTTEHKWPTLCVVPERLTRAAAERQSMCFFVNVKPAVKASDRSSYDKKDQNSGRLNQIYGHQGADINVREDDAGSRLVVVGRGCCSLASVSEPYTPSDEAFPHQGFHLLDLLKRDHFSVDFLQIISEYKLLCFICIPLFYIWFRWLSFSASDTNDSAPHSWKHLFKLWHVCDKKVM